MTSRLLVLSTTPATIQNDRAVLDKKFVTGMDKYASMWNGPVLGLLPFDEAQHPFSETYSVPELSFELVTWHRSDPISPALFEESDLVLAGGDDRGSLDLVPHVHAAGAKIVYLIENIPSTRRRIIMLDRTKNYLQKMRALLWVENAEKLRRRAFAQADGLQINGYPAWEQYASLSKSPLLFLDNRILEEMLPTAELMRTRNHEISAGKPLQIVHAGRLEALKGSHELVPIARELQARGVSFDLHIFGSGSLENTIRKDRSAAGLDERIHLHGPVDFARELVPFYRERADLFLCCHLQADPSCTYIECFGAGLPIVGFGNPMWTKLQAESQGGWVTPMHDITAAASRIQQLDENRLDITSARQRALKFAEAHLFETEFKRRLEHLKQVGQFASETTPAGIAALEY